MTQVISLYSYSGGLEDTISAEYEDALCLETLGDLAKNHQNSDPKGTKCSIIARVQTCDPKQPNKVI
jgi:hypothetical protein